MADIVAMLEKRRLVIQAHLDGSKAQSERNRMGQFATPSELSHEILRYAKATLDDKAEVRFIDPAIGTGSFFSALLKEFPSTNVTRAVGYELDPHYGKPAAELWKRTLLDVRLEDFTLASPPSDGQKFNLLICNPPYVRHHYIVSEDKRRLKLSTQAASGMNMSGLAGLYCYFLGLSHEWVAEDGLAGWLIPSEFMDVNYGESVKTYLLGMVTLLHIHRFDPTEVQFGDALVSSSIVWFKNRRPPTHYEVRMTYGGSLLRPKLERMVPAEALRNTLKWTRYPMKKGRSESQAPVIGDFFNVKRGIATGNNRYFILSAEDVERLRLPIEEFRPILPSPRYLTENEVTADEIGNPLLKRQLFLLDCRLPEDVVKERYPTLWAYLEEGKAQGIADRYICRHRSPWYAQEHRPVAPFLCTYLGRSDKMNRRPFRFILNHSTAIAHNVYLMLYPKGAFASAIAQSPQFKRQVWGFLNEIDSNDLLNEGRVYGGGLHKLEPKELGRVPATALADMLSELDALNDPRQPRLLESPTSYGSSDRSIMHTHGR